MITTCYLVFGIASILVLLITLRKTLKRDYSGSFIKVYSQLLVYYAVYLMPLVILGSVIFCTKNTLSKTWTAVLVGTALLYIYARLIEPKCIKIKHTNIKLSTKEQPISKPVNIALLADLHVGLFDMYPKQLQKIVDMVNQLEDIDAVVIAGDWTYEPEPNLYEDLTPLSQIKFPCYHVLGNHDEQCPGPDVSARLLDALTRLGIKDIECSHVDLTEVNLVGVGDLWANKVAFDFQPEQINNKPCVILAHNPDTVEHIPEGLFSNRPLMLSGHTHGGQIHVPVLVPWLFKLHSATGYCEGLYQHDNAQVFVTAGLGMVDMPFRINMPPRIDVLHIA